MKIATIQQNDDAYPKQLHSLNSPPKQLYALGNSDLLQSPMVSVVGSRKVTPYGRQVTEMICSELSERGITITSGLAFGVDIVSHRSAQSVGAASVAVMPAGLDSISPVSNRDVARAILAHNGLLISEYPVGMPAFKQNFVARNRIVAGLSRAVIVTEAAEKSGTLHTAQFAIDQGIPVCAVPGNITSSLSHGTNQLIKSGAHLITCAQDVLEIIGLSSLTNPKHAPLASNSAEDAIINLIQQGITDASTLQLQSKLAPDVFNQTLTMLEITGKIMPQGTNHWSFH